MGRAKAKPINEGRVGLGVADGLDGGAIGVWFDWAGVDYAQENFPTHF